MRVLLRLVWRVFGLGSLGSGSSVGRCARFLLRLELLGFALTEVIGLGRRHGRLVFCNGLKLGGGRTPTLILARRRGVIKPQGIRNFYVFCCGRLIR